ncbi:MAG: toll/interleukin-1 receptor domain-containing protein, partial [Agathobacter sp.]|nr:toll/interleukin-1 receptor domain-containing protein [Agathobacter sp.]
MKVITRDGSTHKGKKNIYFCAHPEDYDYYHKELSRDIFRYINCAIWSEENLSQWPQEQEIFYKGMDLVMVPVSGKLLMEDNVIRDLALPTLMDLPIPILPVIPEPGLFEMTNEFFSNRQVLDMYTKDDTALEYREKLQRFLEMIFVGDEQTALIQAAFDAHLFISYRKKDRKRALELMGRIHASKELRSMGIWYDEFLTPTEDFDDEIKDSITDCHSVILLVTANTLSEGNYIITDEYPFSKEKNKNVVAILTDGITEEEAYAVFPEIDVCISWEAKNFDEQLLNALGDIPRNDKRPEDIYHLG